MTYPERLTAFVVDMHGPGVETRPLRQMTGEAEFNEVYFTDTRIPDSERLGNVGEVLGASSDQKRTTLLFAIEEQSVLRSVGAHVLPALEQELTAVVASQAGQGAIVAPIAPGVVAASVTKKNDPAAMNRPKHMRQR